ncbi:MAG: hypothetical protein JW900_14430 [Anaerolineae bacterium]|nr:hypothetical protein [Anaerolineae bacterium]
MNRLQVYVVGPGKRRTGWRLPPGRPVKTFLDRIVEHMELPSHLNWRLVTPSNQTIKGQQTLASANVHNGQTLTLQTLRDQILQEFLDMLYDEAEGYVQDKLWDKALEKLEELHEYDPRYPDPRGLQKLAAAGLAPSAVPVGGISWGLVGGAVAVAGALAAGAVLVTAAVALVGAALLWNGGGGGGTSTGGGSGGGGTITSGGDGVVPHTGDVQVTLEWYNTADLDLYVVDPFGEEVYHGHRLAASGGELDVDANYPCSSARSNPIENVYWPWGGAPGGEYQVHVRYYGECNSEGTSEFLVTIRVDGEVIDSYPGQLLPGEESLIARFER